MGVREILLPHSGIPQEACAASTEIFSRGGILALAAPGVDVARAATGVRTAITDETSPFGLAAAFNGSSSVVDFGACPIGLGGPLTLFAAFRVGSYVARHLICARDASGNSAGLEIGDTSLTTVAVTAAAGGANLVGLRRPTGSMATGVWYVVFATVTGSTAQALYVNGVAVSTEASGGFAPPTSSSVMLGTRLGSPGYLSGAIATAGILPFIATAEQIAQWSANLGLLFDDQRIIIPRAAAGGAAALEAAPTISVTAAAGLTTAIQVIGAAVVQAAAAGDLATAIQLAGAAQAGGSATGDLLTSIDLVGAAVSATLAAGDLSAQIRLDGAALASALAAAGLTTSIDVAGDATGAAQATGDITTVIRLSGDAVAAVLAAGDLTAPGSGLEGHATGGASASGDLTTQIPLAGGATVSVIAAGDLATTISMAGAAVGIVSATGDLVIALSLSGDAIAAALAGASLTTSISMLGAAVATAQAGGTLAGTVYKASARRAHVAARRIRTHVAPDRHRTYMAPRRVRNTIAGLL